jgi:hypothetical protein
MADNMHVEGLKALREALLAKRRKVGRTMLDLRRAETTDAYGIQWAAEVVQIQGQIEAIDRAISDEHALAG